MLAIQLHHFWDFYGWMIVENSLLISLEVSSSKDMGIDQGRKDAK